MLILNFPWILYLGHQCCPLPISEDLYSHASKSLCRGRGYHWADLLAFDW